MRSLLILVVAASLAGCESRETNRATTETLHTTTAFEIYWPPIDPEAETRSRTPPLLNGLITLTSDGQINAASSLRLSVTLIRPSTEADRLYWNKSLAFADIHWMSEVRVWDVDDQWLWPNLPFMMRLPGAERVERYGGVDPGKGVDNDFAAVLIRLFDESGNVESIETRDSPLASAEWRNADGTIGHVQTVVHSARSDEFEVPLIDANRPARGMLKVWLIYADFLDHALPRSWPQTPEHAGGILAYFEVVYDASIGKPMQFDVRPMKPKAATGFDWSGWVQRAPGSQQSSAAFRRSTRDAAYVTEMK